MFACKAVGGWVRNCVPYFIRNFSLLSFGEEAEEEEVELSSVNKVSEFCGFSLFTLCCASWLYTL